MIFSRGTAALMAASLTLGLTPTMASASSHREAPLITETPKLDGTDFYMFRSYEPGRSNYVTMIANYLPLQDPFGGPNYFTLDPNAVYDIHIDNQGEGVPTFTFRFRFTNTDRGLPLTIGGKSVPVALTELGQINSGVPATQNVVETYTISLVTYASGHETETPITNATTGSTTFAKPVDNIGTKTIPDYASYVQPFTYPINIPNCGTGKVFAGQRAESFVIALGDTFDLINYKHPIGEQYAKSAPNSLAYKNITSLAVEVPISCLLHANDPVIGGWTTSAAVKKGDDGIKMKQASRLGNPLVNELVIGLPDKDKFNASVPVDDAQFLTYVTNPTFPKIVETLFGTAAPTAIPRQDLVAVFLTGLTGLNAPKQLVHPGEEMRLNTDTAPQPQGKQNRLGVIGGDAAGYPNGRRPGDDVVDITLRVAMGKLFVPPTALFGKPSDAPSGDLEFTDGAWIDSTFFGSHFPYLRDPHPGAQ